MTAQTCHLRKAQAALRVARASRPDARLREALSDRFVDQPTYTVGLAGRVSVHHVKPRAGGQRRSIELVRSPRLTTMVS